MPTERAEPPEPDVDETISPDELEALDQADTEREEAPSAYLAGPALSQPEATTTSTGAITVLVAAGVLLASVLVYLGFQQSGPSNDTPTGGSSFLSSQPPIALPPVGSYAASRITDRGDIQVTQWIRTQGQVREIELAVPMSPSATGSPEATGVVVAVDHFVIEGKKTVRTAARYTFGTPARLIYIRYTLAGAIERSPSEQGRVLARFTSLDVRYRPEQGPTKVNVTGGHVLNAACTSPADPLMPRPCGAPKGDAWQVDLAGSERDDQVMAQVDLD